MKKYSILSTMVLLGLFIGMFFLTPAYSAPGTQEWHYSDIGGDLETFVAIDSKGNSIIATGVQKSSESHWKISSVDNNGHTNWKRETTGLCDDQYLTGGIAVDSEDNIIAAGVCYDKTSSAFEWFIVSYSSTGNENWETTYEVDAKASYLGMLGGLMLVNSVAVDSNDNVIVVGATYLNEEHKSQAMVLSLDKQGKKRWAYRLPNIKFFQKVVVDPSDNVIAAGIHEDGNGYVASFSSSGTLNWENLLPASYPSNITLAVNEKGAVVVIEPSGGDWLIRYLSSSGTKLWDATADGSGHLSGDTPAGVVFDSEGNIIVAGTMVKSDSDWDICVASYNTLGTLRWKSCHDGTAHGKDRIYSLIFPRNVVAVDPNNNVIVVGEESNVHDTSGTNNDWVVVCYSNQGNELWSSSVDISEVDVACEVAVNPETGEVVVGGFLQGDDTIPNNVYVVAYEGYEPVVGHTLVPSEARTIDPPPSTPDTENGKYLGFGDCVSGGTSFKIEAAFPRYLNQNDNSALSVKIFVAGGIPSAPNLLIFFDTSNNLKVLPPDTLGPWRKGVTDPVEPTVLIPPLSLTDTAIHDALAGTNYWFTLVVPNSVADDLSDVDWDNTPWELTVNVFEIR